MHYLTGMSTQSPDEMVTNGDSQSVNNNTTRQESAMGDGRSTNMTTNQGLSGETHDGLHSEDKMFAISIPPPTKDDPRSGSVSCIRPEIEINTRNGPIVIEEADISRFKASCILKYLFTPNVLPTGMLKLIHKFKQPVVGLPNAWVYEYQEWVVDLPSTVMHVFEHGPIYPPSEYFRIVALVTKE